MNSLALIFPKSPGSTSGDRQWKLFQRHLRVPKGWQVSRQGIPDPPPACFIPEIGLPAILLFCARSEVDYPFIVRVLDLLGLDHSRRRPEKGRSSFPWVLASVKTPGVNPEPLAPFVDGFLLGKPEDILPRLCAAFSRNRGFWASPAAIVPGLYVPRNYRVKYTPAGMIRGIVPRFPFSQPVPYRCPLPAAWWRRHFPGAGGRGAVARGKRAALWPVGGSARLRRLLGRPPEEEHYLSQVPDLLQRGVENFTLHFFVGLPGEGAEDREGIIRLVKRLRHAVFRFRRPTSFSGLMTVNLVSFSPKPFTPVQWEGMFPLSFLQLQMKTVVSALRAIPGVQVVHDLPKWAYLYGILARGDRRAGEFLGALARRGGDWWSALKEVNLNPDFYTVRERSLEELLPWDHLEGPVPRQKLEDQARAWRQQAGNALPAFPPVRVET